MFKVKGKLSLWKCHKWARHSLIAVTFGPLMTPHSVQCHENQLIIREIMERARIQIKRQKCKGFTR